MKLLKRVKEYYRLDELKDIGIPEGEIRFLIEQSNLQPVFYLPLAKYVLGGFIQGKFNGFAIANYKGLVSIPTAKLDELLKIGKVKTVHVSLIQRENISVISYDYPFDVACPNNFIEGWKKADLKTFKLPVIPAQIYPKSFTNPENLYFKLLNKLSDGATSNVQAIDTYQTQRPYALNDKILCAEEEALQFAEICIQHVDLVRLELVQETTNNQTAGNKIESQSKLSVTSELFKNEFEELIARILLDKPLLKAKEIHRILCHEAANEEGCRLYDKSDILLGETDGVISWRDKYRGNAERSYKLDSLRNVISDVRKVSVKI